MAPEQKAKQGSIWKLLSWQGPSRRILLKRGVCVLLIMAPLSAILVLVFRDCDQPLPWSSFLIAIGAVDIFLTGVLGMFLYGIAAVVYLNGGDERHAFALVEWGNGVALCVAWGLFAFGVVLCFVQ